MKTLKILRKLSLGAGMECERRGRETRKRDGIFEVKEYTLLCL